MEIKIEQEDEIKIIKIVGDLDGTTADEAREEIVPQIDKDAKLVFDMGQCGYVSSAGLRVLLITAKKIKAVEAYGVLANLLEEVKDVMEMTGFGHILPTAETVDEAVAQIKEEG